VSRMMVTHSTPPGRNYCFHYRLTACKAAMGHGGDVVRVSKLMYMLHCLPREGAEVEATSVAAAAALRNWGLANATACRCMAGTCLTRIRLACRHHRKVKHQLECSRVWCAEVGGNKPV
jgi:hypothetical protein